VPILFETRRRRPRGGVRDFKHDHERLSAGAERERLELRPRAPITTTLPIGNTIEQLHALADIVIERQRQDRRSPKEAPDHAGAEGSFPAEALVERVREVEKIKLEEEDGALRQELIEVAAICVKWLEVLDHQAQRSRLRETSE
jgi:hypothetical protein